MNDDIRVHLSEIKRFEEPKNKYIRVQVDIWNNHEDLDKFWNCSFIFMLKENKESISEIEKEAFKKAKFFINEALTAIKLKEY